MPVSVVVGGQFGSEGKGKVAHFIAQEMSAAAAVRVGGPNSGHTVVTPEGRIAIFRQLPTAAILPHVNCVLPAGAYLNVDVLLTEIEQTALPVERLWIDPQAVIVTDEDKGSEISAQLRERIGSTLSGTGAALARRVSRDARVTFSKDEPRLKQYIKPVAEKLRGILASRGRVVIEGTQGYGLSLIHGSYPAVTSRDTTAAAFVAEAGLSPLDVDDIVLVIRAFPIRVAGNSGHLPFEIDWATVTQEAGSADAIVEYTSVTNMVRRVGRFDPSIVRRAILVNQPTRIVLNHVDYVDAQVAERGALSDRMLSFVEGVRRAIGTRIDYIGLSRTRVTPTGAQLSRVRAGG
jgi:adenylosuccinate synthase